MILTAPGNFADQYLCAESTFLAFVILVGAILMVRAILGVNSYRNASDTTCSLTAFIAYLAISAACRSLV